MAMINQIDQLACALNLKRRIVGVKFLEDEIAWEKSHVRSAINMFSFCKLVKIAAAGTALKANEENFKCPGARRTFRMMAMDDHFRSGGRYFELGLYETKAVAKCVAGSMAFLPVPVFGVMVAPLESFDEPPDVVIIITDAYNGMRILQGYTYHFGPAKGIRSCGNQGVCCELAAQPYVANEINLSLLCSGTRFSCRWKDGEIGVGMPYFMFSEVVSGVIHTANATEPDRKKALIKEREKERGVNLHITWGENYYGSDPGTGKRITRHGWDKKESS